MMSYDKASPNAKIGCSKSNDPEVLEQLVREGKTNREISLILDLDYGYVAQILSRYPELAKAIDSAEERLRLYRETGNTEWLVDLANFAMIEYMHPSHPQAHFRATGGDESPGLKNGISYKELMEEGDE